VHLCATLPNLLPLEVQFGETERFFTMISGHDLRFQEGNASLPQAPGLGVALDEASAQLSPWQPMAQPWLDPRLG
jgi:L-alanine-DL-glutamate epimerase-like enolase superfamily enzyme